MGAKAPPCPPPLKWSSMAPHLVRHFSLEARPASNSPLGPRAPLVSPREDPPLSATDAAA